MTVCCTVTRTHAPQLTTVLYLAAPLLTRRKLGAPFSVTAPQFVRPPPEATDLDLGRPDSAPGALSAPDDVTAPRDPATRVTRRRLRAMYSVPEPGGARLLMSTAGWPELHAAAPTRCQRRRPEGAQPWGSWRGVGGSR